MGKCEVEGEVEWIDGLRGIAQVSEAQVGCDVMG